jgi:hypothetical protein
VNYCPSNLLSCSPPPLPKVKVQYIQASGSVWRGEGVGCWVVLETIFCRSSPLYNWLDLEPTKLPYHPKQKPRKGGVLRQINTFTRSNDIWHCFLSIYSFQGRDHGKVKGKNTKLVFTAYPRICSLGLPLKKNIKDVASSFLLSSPLGFNRPHTVSWKLQQGLPPFSLAQSSYSLRPYPKKNMVFGTLCWSWL